MRKRHFYHLSDVDHGPVLATKKRPPECRAKSEPDVPRICVAANIPDCLSAKLMRLDRKVWIYRTERPIKGVKPFSLWDAFLTEERWMWHPASVVRIGHIEPALIVAAQQPLHRFHANGWDAGYKVRIASLKLAWDALGAIYPNKHRQNFADTLAAKFLKCSPQQFLIEENDRRHEREFQKRMKAISTR